MNDDYPELTYDDETYLNVMKALAVAAQMPERMLLPWIKDEDIKVPAVETKPTKKSDAALLRAIGGR